MKDSDKEQFFCQVVSLAYSKYDELRKVLEPHYGIVTYEILNIKTYYNLAMIPPMIDVNGYESIPLTNRRLKKIAEKGIVYDPAGKHYNKNGNVICDKCRKMVNVAIGYSDNNDLCLECFEEIKTWN